MPTPRSSRRGARREPEYDSLPLGLELDLVPGASPESAISVHMLTSAARELVEGAFPPLWVRGEVSDFKAHRNGHWYFSLRDADAQLKCVVWATQARRVPAPPDDGMQVLVRGQMTVWPVRGDLQFSVAAIEAEGDGLWRKALELTRLRLEADGLLEESRKRPLPRYPRRVAVITSPDGAALFDIVKVARGRSPAVEIVIIPCKVQGEGAPEELAAMVERAGRWLDADVLIIGRGGGAREDLWAFNDEGLVRAIAACPIPTISAVGHETDITLSDLVADMRAATPSAAAELAVPSQRELMAQVRTLASQMTVAALRRQERCTAVLASVRGGVSRSAVRVVERRQARLMAAAGRLDALSPLATLQRGYSVARDPDGTTLSNSAQFTSGAVFDLWISDGIVRSVVQQVRALPAPQRERPTKEHE